MSNVKSKFSLSFVMLLVVIMSIGSVFAADEVNRIFNLSATYEGQALSNNQTITVDESKKDGKINVTVTPEYVDDSLTIVYIWGSNAMETASTGSKTASIPFPTLKAGTTTLLQIEAYINDQKDNYVGNSNVLRVYVKVPQATTLTANLKDGNTTVTVGSTIEKEVGDVLSVVTSSNRTVKQIFYRWNSEELKTVNNSTATISVPNYAVGSKNKLAIQAVTDDGYYSAGRVYYVEIKEDVVVEPETKVSVVISKVNDSEVKLNAKVENDTFSKFVYNWDGEADKTLTVNPSNVTVPTTVGTHTLTVKAYAADGTVGKATYKFTVEAPEVIDDELIVEPWMKEDKTMEELAVSLRNDSDKYDKGNKNFYALNEEVVYYVDYKNGGDDITREIKLVLELPLNFKVIDSFGGVVDSKENTITWTFPEGLEEDQAGTKVVKVAYTSLSKSSKKYEIVYPVADIYERNKVIDSSAVINYIFKDEETEIKDEHYPYMFGDADADTFRPDSEITRAEGALVLTRIFGIDTSGTTIEPLFPDLNETYIEAQKAIVAATKLGLINGYPEDGTYRPNEKMTRAEFMKIIARYIEANAENEDIRGLEVKEDTNIKLYKDPTKLYITGTTSVEQHWASNYISMLIRLNMTPVSSSNKDLELDEKITRAEVAQLVNFYLLRAPAEVSSSTKTQFSDVSKRHDLFEDIVEATRAEHTYTITKEGYEVEVEDED